MCTAVTPGMTEPTSAQDLFKGRHFDQEIIVLCVRWYLAFKLSSRDLVQMMAERGIGLDETQERYEQIKQGDIHIAELQRMSMPQLIEQARKHRVLKATKFVGRLDHADLVRLLHRADVAVLPSHYEPFGIVALEAAATGTPLVTSNVGGLGEAVISGQTGVSCAPRDVAGLAAAVRVVLDDPAAAQRRAVAARERLTSDFDWHTVAGETAQVYLAAKRREREPQPRRPIVEHALPDR